MLPLFKSTANQSNKECQHFQSETKKLFAVILQRTGMTEGERATFEDQLDTLCDDLSISINTLGIGAISKYKELMKQQNEQQPLATQPSSRKRKSGTHIYVAPKKRRYGTIMSMQSEREDVNDKEEIQSAETAISSRIIRKRNDIKHRKKSLMKRRKNNNGNNDDDDERDLNDSQMFPFEEVKGFLMSTSERKEIYEFCQSKDSGNTYNADHDPRDDLKWPQRLLLNTRHMTQKQKYNNLYNFEEKCEPFFIDDDGVLMYLDKKYVARVDKEYYDEKKEKTVFKKEGKVFDFKRNKRHWKEGEYTLIEKAKKVATYSMLDTLWQQHHERVQPHPPGHMLMKRIGNEYYFRNRCGFIEYARKRCSKCSSMCARSIKMS